MPSRSILILSPLLATTSVAAFSLPYNPASIILGPRSDFAYIFQPSSQNVNQSTLQSFNLSANISASSFTATTLFDALPFLEASSPRPYTPLVDESGNITVIGGTCAENEEVEIVWRFAPAPGSPNGNGTWTRLTAEWNIQAPQSPMSSISTGFLAGGAAFSQQINASSSNTTLYSFGGMCPEGLSTIQNWVNDANYSSTLLSLVPSSEGNSFQNTTYTISDIPDASAPVAEAGFSITGLSPSLAISKDGHTQTQQQDFLLLGGHTESAFINMSQVAILSLPQQTWSFLSIQQPLVTSTKAASTTQIEPRSGHSAVLSEDGSRVIIVGGWVGDITNAAQPQLLVLQLGTGYGGNESEAWSWTIPNGEATNSPSQGVFGHGAALLPGNVMMITGGYSISSSSASSRKRATPAANSQVYFYNITSQTWVASYSGANQQPATAGAASGSAQSGSGPLSQTSQQVGLGIGVGLGVLFLAGLILLFFWLKRRSKLRRQNRERTLTAHSSNASIGADYQYAMADNGGFDGRGSNPFTDPHYFPGSSTIRGVYQPASKSGEMETAAGSTGLFVDIPSPTRGLRKGLAGRPYTYHAASRFDDARGSRRRGGKIHPIPERQDEDDEEELEDTGIEGTVSEAEQKLREVQRLFDSNTATQLDELEQVLKSVPAPIVAAAALAHEDPFLDGSEHHYDIENNQLTPLSNPNPLGSHPYIAAQHVPVHTVRRVPTALNGASSPMHLHLTPDSEGNPNWRIVDGSESEYTSSSGRVSPSKTEERTSSFLSERSQRSNVSAISSSVGSAGQSLNRTLSARAGQAMAAAFAVAAGSQPEAKCYEITGFLDGSSDDQRSSTMSSSGSSSQHRVTFRPGPHARIQVSQAPAYHKNQHLALPKGLPGRSVDSFMTAHTSFVQLQGESEALLGSPSRSQYFGNGGSPSRPLADRDDPYQRAAAAAIPTRRIEEVDVGYDSNTSDPSFRNSSRPRSQPPLHFNAPPLSISSANARKKPGWMGSLRRAITGMSNISTTMAPRTGARSFSLTTPQSPSRDVPTPISAIATGRRSPQRPVPRRTVSDGGTSAAALLRAKRGRRDWTASADDEPTAWRPYFDHDTQSPTRRPIPTSSTAPNHTTTSDDWGEPLPPPSARLRQKQLSVRNRRLRRGAQGSPRRAPNGVDGSNTLHNDSARHAHAHDTKLLDNDPSHSSPSDEDPDEDEDDTRSADWDVEAAASTRDVQVLFTVPKTKLRVVNADEASLLSRTGNSSNPSSAPVSRESSTKKAELGGASSAPVTGAALADAMLQNFGAATAGPYLSPHPSPQLKQERSRESVRALRMMFEQKD